MACATIGKWLDRVAEFETRIEAFYAGVRDCSTDNNVRFLSYYLSRHGYRLQAALAALTPSLRDHVRAAQLKRRLVFSPELAFYAIKTPPGDIKGTPLLDAALRYDAELAGLYRQMLGQSPDSETSTVLESLVHMEERDMIILKKIQAMQNF